MSTQKVLNPKIIIVTAPSGAGKTTMVRHILKTFNGVTFSVSATTRAKRVHEVEGKDYYFLSHGEFEQYIAEAKFAEWQEVYANQFYGTLKSEIEKKRGNGFHVVFDIDVQGAINLAREYAEDVLTIFIKPPSMQTLEKRLRLRKTETQEKLDRRLTKARSELKLAYIFDKVVYNNVLETALNDISNVVSTFLSKVPKLGD